MPCLHKRFCAVRSISLLHEKQKNGIFRPTEARLPLLMMPQTSMCTFKDILRHPSIAAAQSAEGNARRIAEQGFLRTLYHTFRKKERGNICFPKKVANRHAVKFVSPLRAFLRECTSLSLPSRQFPFKLFHLPAIRFVLTDCARVRSFSMLRRIGLRSLVDRASQPSFAVHLIFRTDAPFFSLNRHTFIFHLSEQALFRSFSPRTAFLRSFSLRAAVPSGCFPRSAITFLHFPFYVARIHRQNPFISQLLPKNISGSEPLQRAPSLKITVRSVKHLLRQSQDRSCPVAYSASAESGWQASTEHRQVWHQIHFP